MLRKQQKAVAKRQREAELKRLRIAQEIQRHLEEVEFKQRQVEERGIEVERALRGEGKGQHHVFTMPARKRHAQMCLHAHRHLYIFLLPQGHFRVFSLLTSPALLENHFYSGKQPSNVKTENWYITSGSSTGRVDPTPSPNYPLHCTAEHCTLHTAFKMFFSTP